MDENENPVPFANIFVRELASGVSAGDDGKFFLTIDPGVYNFTVSSVGFHTKNFLVVVKDKAIIRDFEIQSSSVQLNSVEVRARRRDPAYEIIQKVIANRDKYLAQSQSFRTQVYMRATEIVDRKKKNEPRSQEEEKSEGPPEDKYEREKNQEEARLQSMNLTEMQITLNYQFPELYKEERTAYKSYGTREGLFIPIFSQTDFNFYHNLVDLKGVSEVPMISPVSRGGLLSYKYKLDEIAKQEGTTVYKIRVTPRKSGDATGRGYLYINDSTWNIREVDFTLQKGGLKFYDAFNIKQSYEEVADSLWIPMRQEFVYETKAGSKLFKGNTVLVFSDFENNYTFAKKFFGNEVAVTTAEAYKKDSTFWNTTRPEPLTGELKEMVSYRDSVEAAHTTKHYLDSMEAKFNRVTLGEVVYHGIGFRSEEKKSFINFPSVVNLIDFAVIGGFRVGPYVRYFRRYDNGRMIHTGTSLNVGVKNYDINGNVNMWTRYNPHKLGDASVYLGRNFYSVNSNDAYLNQLRISNYILHQHVDLFHRIELVNGLYVSTDLGFADRQSVATYDATSLINVVLKEDDPLRFQRYQALITNLRLAFTPGQEYMTEPTRKIVLGSKYPTFTINHRKGWSGVFGSDVDFDYIDFGLNQNLMLGTLGNSKYSFVAGKFVNTKDLRFIDLKRFRQSDPYLLSNPLFSFQLLDTSLHATDWFVEAHYTHYFNGALINNIPLIKKLKLRTVAGAGFMWIKESDFRHEEVYGGIERIFKLGARRRLKIGFYGVLAQSNFAPPKADWKISFDIIDTWKRDWSY